MLVISTSFLDKNYYVVNGGYESLYLTTILEGNKYADQIAELFRLNLANRNHAIHLFVEKKSSFGMVLTKLIKENKINDEQLVIRREKIVSAFIQLNLEESNDKEMLSVVTELVKKQYHGISVMDLSKEYDVELLKQIVALGMQNQKYLPELNSSLTGYEEEGYVCEGIEKWYLFNVVTKDKKALRRGKSRIKEKW